MSPVVAPVPVRSDDCCLRVPEPAHGRERGLWAVVALTAVMMVVEIVAGYATHSMALTADGWHMATHVGALGMSAIAYAISRRFASHQAFVFGTGKVPSLAGYTSALLLAVVALSMVYESLHRLFDPNTIDFASSLPVAVVGLLVNLLSVRLLHGHEHHDHERAQHGPDQHHDHHHDHDHHHEHHHEHDHNHRAAVMHVIADALTSALAIGALLAGRYWAVLWLDPVTGMVGGVVILKWAYELCKHAGYELLNVELDDRDQQRVRHTLEQTPGLRVLDLHVWSLGAGKRCGIASVYSQDSAISVEALRSAVLAETPLTHLTLEVRASAAR